MDCLRNRVAICGVALLFPLCPLPATGQARGTKANPASWSVSWRPAQVVNGAPILFRVKPPQRLASLRGSWLSHDLIFDFDSRTGTWYALAGASLETRPGNYPLSLAAETPQGQGFSLERKLRVAHARYRSVALSVPRQYTEPNAAQLEEIKQENALKHEVFLKTSADREWSGSFLPPVEASVTDWFGTARKFNGVTQSVHQGLDYGVPQGTVITATNNGMITLAQKLFFEGNCVVLDHGQGLLTIYMHLEEIKVKEGDRVARGQEIGLSGATGRATGAHLHVAVRWQGVYLNPSILFILLLPRS